MMHIKKLVMYGFKSFPKKTELPFTEGINVILGPNGSGKSSSYDTLVTLSTGEEIELGKIVEEKIRNSEDIKTLKDGIYVDGDKNIKILSLNKNSMRVEEKIISKFIRREGDPLYKITTSTGKEVKATGCHPVMVFKDGEIKSSLIRDLREGDLVASPRRIILNSKEYFDKDIARLLGYIIGDGYIAKDRIEFVNKDPEAIEDFKNILNEKFKIKFVERHEKNITRIYVRDKPFVSYIRSLFAKESKNSITSKDKKIPKEILISDNLAVSNLLAGLYDTDGSIRKDIAVIELCTKNKSLAYQVQGLLLRFGIISKVKLRVCCASNTKERIKRDYFYIYISGKNNLRNFYNNIHVKIDYKRKNILNHLSKETIENTNVDLLPEETNRYIKELAVLLGIKIKTIRKQYPLLSAYSENRCLPSREGVSRIIELFNNKLAFVRNLFENINRNQLNLVKFMDELNISGKDASESIGLNQVIIRRDWQTSRFNARPENLERFYTFIQESFLQRISRIHELIVLLTNLATSDIFWDKISSMHKVDEEKYVYDLTVEDNHNFIANNIFLHNSNISDALCFVLGRLSIKSMRAAKAGNLIFLGTKAVSPAKEASVEIIFDNSDKTFSIDKNEISLKRIVRKNGQSIYKINNETKTRQQMLGLLAQAGIDPNGFNIILQGEIQNFVRMYPDDRRKIIEEVSGISIYEARKEKSLKELNKTEEKLKEVSAILRERTAYLNNLEKERQQALRYKKLKKDVEVLKASIISFDLNKNKKELEITNNQIKEKNKEIEKNKKIISTINGNIENFESKIILIEKTIQNSTGLEQEKLNSEITNIRAELSGLNVRYENSESKNSSLLNQKKELEETINESTEYVLDLKKTISKSPSSKQNLKSKEIELKKENLEKLEEQRKKFYTVKSELKSIKERLQDKKSLLENYENESEFLLRQSKILYGELFDKNTNESKLESLKSSLEQKKELLDNLNKKEIRLERISSVNENEIDNEKKLIENIAEMDVCPVCKSKITEEHVSDINKETLSKIDKLKTDIEKADKELASIYNKRDLLKQDIEQLNAEISKRESDLIKISNINEKKEQIKDIQEKIQKTNQEIEELEKIRKKLETTFEENQNIEQKYETARIEVQEISLRNDEDVDSEISFKQRELDRAKIALKQILREQEDLKEEQNSLSKIINEKEQILEKKKKQEEELTRKFKNLISEKDNFQKEIRNKEYELSKNQNIIYNLNQNINDFKIDNARVNAIIENLEKELLEFKGISIVKSKRENLVERLVKVQNLLEKIGTINLRSLEVYDSIKKEYDSIREKAEIVEKEEKGILKIISEIDIKKKRAFLKTLESLNEKFSRNFAQLSTKGQVSLDLENRKEPFEAGVNIIVKTGHGKYFDVKSLSGGEQVLVALSLIFAIQELNPYCFYILDEIDAALDKRNSERLANLLQRYMKKGQYIVITHNDEIISNATNLYGISMHDGISKIISLKV